MSAPSHVSIERRRFAALIEALKMARDALKYARLYQCGNTDNYVVAAKIERALADGREVHS
jgi:hypothetical protein